MSRLSKRVRNLRFASLLPLSLANLAGILPQQIMEERLLQSTMVVLAAEQDSNNSCSLKSSLRKTAGAYINQMRYEQ